MYDGTGHEYWWDYPEEVAASLEASPTLQTVWVWQCPPRYGWQEGKIIRYLLDPVQKVQRNMETHSTRRMRRIMVVE